MHSTINMAIKKPSEVPMMQTKALLGLDFSSGIYGESIVLKI